MVESFIIVWASSGPLGFGACGESQITLAAPSTVDSVLSRDMASAYEGSPTFPNIPTDKIHLSLTLARTFFLAII